MFRLWVREFKETHMIKDIVIEDDSDDTRTHKIMNALEKACTAFDLAVPIWLDNNISDFKGKCSAPADVKVFERLQYLRRNNDLN